MALPGICWVLCCISQQFPCSQMVGPVSLREAVQCQTPAKPAPAASLSQAGRGNNRRPRVTKWIPEITFTLQNTVVSVHINQNIAIQERPTAFMLRIFGFYCQHLRRACDNAKIGAYLYPGRVNTMLRQNGIHHLNVTSKKLPYKRIALNHYTISLHLQELCFLKIVY